jgi:hypothetical protein
MALRWTSAKHEYINRVAEDIGSCMLSYYQLHIYITSLRNRFLWDKANKTPVGYLDTSCRNDAAY